MSKNKLSYEKTSLCKKKSFAGRKVLANTS